MKVELVKLDLAEFSLETESCNQISFDNFVSLTGYEKKSVNNDTPKMVAFKTKDEFMEKADSYNIDTEKPVYMNNKGYIFCHLKQEGENNVSTSTKKSKE